MKVIKPTICIEDDIRSELLLKKIEKAGRTCYKSENLISLDSATKFVKMIINNGHESVLEHEKITVRIVCDRGVTHEIVRHRIASYSQESTRYCNYNNNKFGNELTLIKPIFWDENSEKDKEKLRIWEETNKLIEENYIRLINLGAEPQEARSILPNSLKSEIVVTMNLREWRHFFKLRTSAKAHPQMREVALMILNEFKRIIPVVFDDI